MPYTSRRARFGSNIVPAFAAAFALLVADATAQSDNVMEEIGDDRRLSDVDSAELDVQFSFGFGGQIWPFSANPLTFLIKNTSTEFFTGRIEVRRNRYYGGENLQIPIEVGQNAQRRFSFGVVPSSWGGEMDLRIVRDGNIIWRRTFSDGTSSYPASPLSQGQSPPVLAVDPEFRRGGENSGNGLSGRGETVLRIAPWEIPDDDRILSPVAAIFLSDKVDFRSLSGPRLSGMARYVAHGGIIFAPSGAISWLEKLVGELPYEITVSPSGRTSVGLGELVIYVPADSFPPKTNDLDRLFGQRPLPNYAGLFQPHDYSARGRGPRARTSISAVSIFVLAYLVAAGPILFFFRKAKRKNVIRALVVIIGLASVSSVALGIFLRTNRGDLSWASVTRAGDGGATQTAIFKLSSGGARNHQLDLATPAITIDDYDFLPGGNFNQLLRVGGYSDSTFGVYYGNDITAPIKPGAAEIALTPLGKKRIHARGPISEVLPLFIDIAVKPKTNSTLAGSITNPNPFPIGNVMLFVADKTGIRSISLPRLPARGSISQDFTLLAPRDSNAIMNLLGRYPPREDDAPYPEFSPWLPNLDLRPGSLVILGTLSSSPGIQPSGDFVESHGTHYFIQETTLQTDPNQIPTSRSNPPYTDT